MCEEKYFLDAFNVACKQKFGAPNCLAVKCK